VVVTVGGQPSNGVIFTVTTSQNITVTVFPIRAGLTVTQTLSVTATTNDSLGVSWTATGGNFSAPSSQTGIPVTYTAPSTAGTYTITATSVTNVTVSASFTVGVTDLAGMYTYHNDLFRDGVNSQEYALSTSNVNTNSFGKLFSCSADGAIYAQPLWLASLTVGGTKHNVVVVATQHDSVYAFDADTAPCTTLWHANLLDTTHGGTTGETSVPSSGTGHLVGHGTGDIAPEVGVTGTPVIDPTTNTLYVVSKSVNASTQFFQRLHAIDLTTGNERVAPHSIDSSISVPGTGDGSVGGQVAFDPRIENQRPGLALNNGIVYVAWASHEDEALYHGWVIAFSASSLAPVTNGVFNSTPNHVPFSNSRGGIWMSGGAPAVDSSGYLYFMTGNGSFDASSGGSNYGDSVLKLNTTNGLSVADYFTPLDQQMLADNDWDLGAGGAAVLVDQTTGPIAHLLIGGGKGTGTQTQTAQLFLLNRDNLGKYNGSTNNVVQTLDLGANSSIFSTAVFWQKQPLHRGLSPSPTICP
jgi:hypothetical protein